jgi:hypothetical protein
VNRQSPETPETFDIVQQKWPEKLLILAAVLVIMRQRRNSNAFAGQSHKRLAGTGRA